ncbi:GNAT family N-acetyltransferase [Olivibacter sitiensis]|uniref:GNAT family N-acetyltransferase n=1 Tax=Olivibacter sitiensis TaxID=376470 RepID=UPI00040CD88C|nr:GNAT family N-acetyltransferase [Olivibacter sitiensis]
MEIINLQKTHNRGSFDSEAPLLDEYIKKQASQDVRRDLSACYVLANEENIVLAYYTLSGNSIPKDDLPEGLLKKLRLPGSYRELPAVLLGRLAVDKNEKGKRRGELMLMNALERCLNLSEQLGTLAVIVDPIDEKAIAFYEKYGFLKLKSSNKMFIPMGTIRQLFQQ